jgi:hypothetical protein
LGGSERDVDVEEIYLKCFELAPARLGWRTRPDLPDYKKAAKALQSVEAKTHRGLVHRADSLHRRLTPLGIDWVERHLDLLSEVYSGEAPVAASNTNENERQRRQVRSSSAWHTWATGQQIDFVELADALECGTASPLSVWEGRLHEVSRAAQVLSDVELGRFASDMTEIVKVQFGRSA